MNRDLAALFQSTTVKLMAVFGLQVTRVSIDGDESPVTVIITDDMGSVGEYGERREPRWTLDIAASTGAVVGDVYIDPGIATPTDPYPDATEWTAEQLLSDDGYIRTFVLSRRTA